MFKVTSSNVLFCPNNQKQEKQLILTVEIFGIFAWNEMTLTINLSINQLIVAALIDCG